MSSYRSIYYHIIFSTKNRNPCLSKSKREKLFRYIWGIIQKNHCTLYQINGTLDHVHMLIDLHPTVALSDLIKKIKVDSNKYIKLTKLFPNFHSWQPGYGAFTLDVSKKKSLMDYIKNQEKHHQKIDLISEYNHILIENGVDFSEEYLP